MTDILESETSEGQETSGTTSVTSSSKKQIDDILNSSNITIIADETFSSVSNIITLALKNNKEELDGAYIISLEHNLGGKKRSSYPGIADAYAILSKNPKVKVILMGFTPMNFLQKIEGFGFLMEHPNVLFLQLPIGVEELNTIKFNDRIINPSTYISLADEIAKRNMGRIKHSLQGVVDPYNPKDESEKIRIQNAFTSAQEYFPGLDTLDKMLDFVLHVNIDIPEKMKGEKIEGVYCDIDGTLIEYVGIHSGKEGTQQLKKSVVELLKKYEQEGKQIYIWTGGDVKKKEAYLRTLGITRPILNKYDYAGATAEIVIDDTDQNAFILQSKILPEIYIDTKDRK